MTEPDLHERRQAMEADLAARREERLAEARHFLELLHPLPQPSSAVVLSRKSVNGKGRTSWQSRWLPARDFGKVASVALGSADKDGLEYDGFDYLATCLLDPQSPSRREGGRGKGDDARVMPGCWADIDIAGPGHADDGLPPDEQSALTLLDEFGLAPSVVVHSGHGLHAWWLFDQPLYLPDPAARAEARALGDGLQGVLRAIASTHGWKLDSTADLARVLRLPGTVNRKVWIDPRPVRILSQGGARYPLAAVRDHLVAMAERFPPQKAGHGAGENGHGLDPEAVLRGAPEGERDVTLFRYACRLRSLNLQRVEAEALVLTAARGCAPPFPDTEALRKVASAWESFPPGRSWDAEADFEFDENEDDEGDDVTSEEQRDVPEGPVPGEGEAAAAHLPDEFWEARPVLGHIRQAAHSRQRSADAVLHAVLARVAAGSPYNLLLPPIVASHVPPCYFAVVLAVPGIGKSSASAIAKELLPLPPDVVDGIPIGSGEGLVEVLFSIIEEPDPANPKKTIKRKVQTRHNVYVYVDEGAVLGKHAERGGATLLETMRTIWTGGVLGQTNATPERGRTVQLGNYAYGMVVGLQPVNAGALLGDVTSGTPQRFTWTLAYDPHIPDSLPLWPGQLDLKSPEPPPEPPCAAPSNGDDEVWFGGTAPGVTVSVDPVVAAEIRAADLAKARTGRVEDLLDTHGDLLQLKTALLLAILDGRAEVTEDDWRLAGVIRGVSDRVRAWLVAQVEAETARKEEANDARAARRAVVSSAAVENRRTVDAARKLAGKVWAEPARWTVATMRRAMRNYRAVFNEAFDHAKAEGWVTERIGAGQGEDQRVLRPGQRRPE